MAIETFAPRARWDRTTLGEWPGERIIVIRQRLAERAEASDKTLFDLPAYRFQSRITNLPASEFNALTVWRRNNGRANIDACYHVASAGTRRDDTPFTSFHRI